jgi:thymidine kinase
MSLNLIVGCMFSGKTTEIINIVNKLQFINKSVLLINSKLDNRYNNNTEIISHNKLTLPCIKVDNLNDILSIINPYDHIIIDESQFITNLYDVIIQLVDVYNKDVTVVGLNGDSHQRNFGEIYLLYPHADNIKYLKALCYYCKDGTPGIFSKKLVNDDVTISIGGREKYIPVCRKCNKL